MRKAASKATIKPANNQVLAQQDKHTVTKVTNETAGLINSLIFNSIQHNKGLLSDQKRAFVV
jgi:hypothetical protein